MLSPVEKEKITKDLSECKDMAQVFNYLNSQFDLSTAKLGFISKGKILDGLVTAIDMLNPKRK